MKIDKQEEVLKYLQTVDQATLSEILDNVPFWYYHNAKKHLGALLSRMIQAKKIERVKNGVFKIKTKERINEPNTLFENLT